MTKVYRFKNGENFEEEEAREFLSFGTCPTCENFHDENSDICNICINGNDKYKESEYIIDDGTNKKEVEEFINA